MVGITDIEGGTMISLSTASIIEKNKVSTDGVYLQLLTIKYKDEDPVRLVYNTEDVTFGGNTYHAYNFNLSEVKYTTSEIPSCTLTVSNITGAIQSLLEQYDGAGGASVNVSIINTNISDVVLQQENFKILSCTSAKDKVTIKLGPGFSMYRRYPLYRNMKDFCPFKFKGIECGYSGAGTCNKTLNDCRKLGNNTRFGGTPTVPQGGMYARK